MSEKKELTLEELATMGGIKAVREGTLEEAKAALARSLAAGHDAPWAWGMDADLEAKDTIVISGYFDVIEPDAPKYEEAPEGQDGWAQLFAYKRTHVVRWQFRKEI